MATSALERLRQLRGTEAPALRAETGPLADLRAGVARLFDYGMRLRCANPPKGDRAQALRFQTQQIEKLAALSLSIGGTADGYPDPSDPWADEALLMLRDDLADLTREDAPYPLGPLTDDPFSMTPPRYHSGRLIGSAA